MKTLVLVFLFLSSPMGTLAQGGVGMIISKSIFDQMLKHRNDKNCPANGFYTYEAFITATNSFRDFGTTGDYDTQKREIAAFLAETTGGWASAPDGPHSWGYCFKQEQGNLSDYCVASPQWPCAPSKKYFGRGPIQISYNYNYGPAGRAIGYDLLKNPDAVANDPIISFKTALWYWMTPQAPKPPCHDAISGRWTPSTADIEAERRPGYGVITNIINGGIECGKGSNSQAEDRIGFYKRYCDLLGVGYGPNLDCYNQRPFISTLTQEGVGSIISKSLFDQMLTHRNDVNCPANGFYTYEAFITAANSFRDFGTTGDYDTKKREIAAFLAQTSQETTGGWASAPDGPYSWGYCFKQEQGNPSDYCVTSPQWPCAPGKKYFGRGPIHISYNYNYGPAGRAIGYDLLKNPDAVANDPIISFKTALWYWMTPQAPKPPCHDAISGRWTPSTADIEAERRPGYGVITNIINGGIECGKGSNSQAEDRIGFYKRYCDLLGVGYGPNLDCYNQRPFISTLTQEGVGSIISKSLFDQMLTHRNDVNCPANGFYTYEAFITAANSFRDFGTTGDYDTKKREIAAFLAQTSQETTGGWASAPDGPYSWGYCFKQEQGNPSDYCVTSPQWPCAPGKKYFGRGPIQISYNYNYGPAGRAIGYDLLKNPDAVANDPIISLKTALWYWMTPQAPKPSCHDAISGRWTPSTADIEAERRPGYGVITNIINGGIECGKGSNSQAEDRIGFYKRYCDLLGVGYGPNLDCYNQRPFISTLTQEGVGSIISKSLFDQMLTHRNDVNCPANGFYTYEAFITAANSFRDFGTTGDYDTKKREIAAFLAQTSQETTGGWASAPDGPYSWGYCFKQEQGNPSDYCVTSPQWPCAPGKKYFGRGPIQISYNYNYGPAGRAIGYDLLKNPDAVANDPIISLKTALWYWMTPQAPKPSCHDAISGRWTPSTADIEAERRPGYGVITNIINGGIECGKGSNSQAEDRIGFYKRYCDLLGVGYGPNLDCYNQRPFISTLTQEGVGSIISKSLFDQMLTHRNDVNCPANGFYTYEAFITAANSFRDFGTTGDYDTKKREIAAFLAQTSQETTGGWASAPDGPYSWGYCFKQEQGNLSDYCVASPQWPCAPSKKYFGRGPIQISYNYNYGPAGRAIGSDLLNNPDAVTNDPIISFKTALWFWMTPQAPKPSCHDAISGRWTPSTTDLEAGRGPGYGVITNIINGGIECGKGSNSQAEDRIGFYKRYCDLLGVGYGPNLDCYNQRPLLGTLAHGGVGSTLASIYVSLHFLFVVHFIFVSYSG